MARNTLARTLHDVGLAAWFGGTLMGATGLNGAAADVDDPRQRARVANAGWARWTPVNAAAIGAHLVGGAMLVQQNKGRLAGQKGVGSWTLGKTVLTGGALAATAYSRVLGQKLLKGGDFPAAGGTEPTTGTPPELAGAQKQLKALQWVIPALTGGLVYGNVVMSEQQKTTEVAKGAVQRLGDAAKHPGAAVSGVTTAVKSVF